MYLMEQLPLKYICEFFFIQFKEKVVTPKSVNT